MAQRVKNPPAMRETQETWVCSLGWEDLLGEEMAAHSSILAWTILWTEEPGGLQSMGSQRVRHERRPSRRTQRKEEESRSGELGRVETVGVWCRLECSCGP